MQILDELLSCATDTGRYAEQGGNYAALSGRTDYPAQPPKALPWAGL
jgi:hypothetical protein